LAKWVIGDIHGCFQELKTLLDIVNFNPSRDYLYSVGDLVNRGPQSYEVVKFLMQLDGSFKMTLGNHDLSLLASLLYLKKCPKKALAFAKSKQRQHIIQWLTQQPLLIIDGDYLICHAGIAPTWSRNKAIKRAEKVTKVLQNGSKINNYLKHMYGNKPTRYENAKTKYDKLRMITNAFTRMRYCTKSGDLDLATPAKCIKNNSVPWFEVPKRKLAGQPIIFGHWALLHGNTGRDDAIALDTGCVYGGRLTMFNLDTKERVSVTAHG